MILECLSYMPVNKGTCRGVATIRVPEWGIKFSSLWLHEKGSSSWISFPSKVKDEEGGRKYYPYVSFDTRERKDEFCQDVKKAVDAFERVNTNQSINTSTGEKACNTF